MFIQRCDGNQKRRNIINILPTSPTMTKIVFWYSYLPVTLVGTLQRTNAENWKQIFPEKGLRGQSPNFHIYVSVSDLNIPTIDLPFLLRKYVDQSWEYIKRSQTHEKMWKLGLRLHNSRKRNTYSKWDIRCSVLCLQNRGLSKKLCVLNEDVVILDWRSDFKGLKYLHTNRYKKHKNKYNYYNEACNNTENIPLTKWCDDNQKRRSGRKKKACRKTTWQDENKRQRRTTKRISISKVLFYCISLAGRKK